ncbi:MAG TPA: SGNH/GDSL hydrolase family protein [Burkholderiaceae bacterium]|jgi:outer membrane lipase/esterase|nr:SGNH/GDSL hydrolase family protein [Burkholderiaceae bacterium]
MIDFSRHAARVLAAFAAAAFLVSCGGSDDDPPPQPAFGQVTYVFGASTSDTGNTCNLLPASCPPTPPYATNRYSNGPVFAEIVAARYGASVTPSRTGGNNFAYGGARTGPIAGTTQSVPNMVTQLDQYLARVNFVSSANALFIVDAVSVGNDIGDALTLSQTNPNAPATVLTGAVTNIVTIINRLYASGARNILVANSTDVGKTPRIQAAGPTAVAGATQLSAQFNGALAQQIAQIRAASPGLNIYVLDTFALSVEATANPAALGYTNATAPCFNDLIAPPTLCATPETYFYWDSFHPTATTHNLAAQRAIVAIGR